MAEGEGPQERAEGGGGHHPVGKHGLAGPRAQHVSVVDVGPAGDDGMDQCQNLAPWKSAADATSETNGGVDQPLEAQAQHQRAYEDEPGVGHQVGIVEAHRNAIDPVRYSTH
jgi:hypothetical protein